MKKFFFLIMLTMLIVLLYSLSTPRPIYEPFAKSKIVRAENAEHGYFYEAGLEKGRLKLFACKGESALNEERCESIFESSSKHYIYDAEILDLTGDGKPELVAMLWKRGNYGGKKPMVDEGFEITDITKSPHIFIWTIEKNGPRPRWFSSMLPVVPERFDSTKLSEEDKRSKLYIEWKHDGEEIPNVWEWRSWGLKSVIND